MAFGLRYDGIEKSKRMHQKTKLVQADDSIKIHNKASEEECKVMNFDHFPKETTHEIKTALEE